VRRARGRGSRADSSRLPCFRLTASYTPKHLAEKILTSKATLAGLGKLSRRTGKREQAREHLTTATSMYREMDMRFWFGPAEAELAEVRA
jgi:hypothetical protein